MENKLENLNKKNVGKAKSYNDGPVHKIRNEAAKRKSFSLNEAVMSLDLALGRLKKSKLVPCGSGVPPATGVRRGVDSDMFMDLSSPSSNINPGLTEASLVSMNFSHYELMRNLSHSTSNSEGAFSGTTCNTNCLDPSLKDERLEKYFRSVEKWHRKHGHEGGSGPSIRFELPDK